MVIQIVLNIFGSTLARTESTSPCEARMYIMIFNVSATSGWFPQNTFLMFKAACNSVTASVYLSTLL